MAAENAHDEILRVERRWVQAHLDLDLDTLEKIMADDYIQIRSDGSVAGKAETLASYQSGARSWNIAISDEYDLRVIGDIDLLVGRWKGRGLNAGKSFGYQARFMAVYTHRNGQWYLLADQSTVIEQNNPDPE